MLALMAKTWSLKPSNLSRLAHSARVLWQKCALFLLLWTCLGGHFSLQAQVEVALKGAQAISQDRKGNIYISGPQGSLDVYDTTGTRLLNYASSNSRITTHVEAWLTLKVFLFYEAFQEYVTLDRFLNPNEPFGLNEDLLGYASAATLSSDEGLWLFDNTDFSLKKYDPNLDRLQVNTPLDLILDPDDYSIVYMREYQNLLLVSDVNTGILLFDNLGNLKRTLEYPGVSYIGVLDNTICFAQENTFVVYDLYTQEDKQVPLPPGEAWKFATLVSGKWVLVSDRLLKILDIPESLIEQNDE